MRFGKTACLCVVFGVIFLFSACATPPDAQGSTTTTASSSASNEQDNGALTLCTDPYGGIFKSGHGIETGYYEQFNLTGEAVNILYTDYKTQQKVYLCNRPECKHNNETCTSWIPTYGDTLIFTDKAQKELFFVSCGYADTPNPTGSQMGKIYKMTLTGAERKVLYQLNGNESFTDAIAIDDNYLYVAIQFVDTAASTMKKELRKIDLDSGNATVIYEFQSTNDRVFGAFQNSIVLQKITNTERIYECLDVRTGTTAELYRHNIDDIRLELVEGSIVYSIHVNEVQENGRMPIYKADLSTGQETKISEIEIYNTDATFITGFYDGKMEISATDNRDLDNIKFNNYYLDLSSYEMYKNTLTFKFFEDTRNVTILAQTQEHFLLETGITQGSVTLVDNAGIPYQVDTAVPIHSLISKKDFWSGNPNYIALQDTISNVE